MLFTAAKLPENSRLLRSGMLAEGVLVVEVRQAPAMVKFDHSGTMRFTENGTG
jgi:hypothetical protein